ncbi:MAG: glucose-1-phosphate cytidylyltransferase [Polyangiaceae bacterium]|nr:glucose-1-phosphate cytidylyltransferase [Polyangiaceae bacterium]
MDPAQIPVFVLCGGFGTRLKEETELRPKPMVPVGNHPILWHILRTYSHHGFKRFVLCLGYKAEVIKSYFLSYASLNSDFTVNLERNEVTVHSVDHHLDWDVTLAYTGDGAMTGARVARAAERYLGDAELFAVTYGDGLTNADLQAELDFHLGHGKIGTLLGARLPSRFGEVEVSGAQVTRFQEKPDAVDSYINGGYFLFRRAFLEYLSADESCVLERKPLVRLAEAGQLCMYRHPGYWACMDTQRDREQLTALWESGEAPWKVW